MSKFSNETLANFKAMFKSRAENRADMVAAYTGGLTDYACVIPRLKTAIETKNYSDPACADWVRMESDARELIKQMYSEHHMPSTETNKFFKLGRCVSILGIPLNLVNVAWTVDEIRRAADLYNKDERNVNEVEKVNAALKYGRQSRAQKEAERIKNKLARDGATFVGAAAVPIIPTSPIGAAVGGEDCLIVSPPQKTEHPEDWSKNFFGELNRFLQMPAVQTVLNMPTPYQRLLQSFAGQVHFIVNDQADAKAAG